MLYVTTTQKRDTYTAAHAIRSDRGKDGGLFAPFQLPVYSEPELIRLQSYTFGQRMAEILNLFFSCRLTAWDIESTVGKCPVKAVMMSHRILFMELWHDPEKQYRRMEQVLAERIRGDTDQKMPVSSWVRIAIRLGLLFHIFAELVKAGELEWDRLVDVSVPAEDFSASMTVWYGRAMGLPIANIICSCNENCGVWDLLHHGQMHMDASVTHTTTPLADYSVPPELERLIFGTLGCAEVLRYRSALERRGLYIPPAERFETLRSGMFAAVISRSRLEVLIPSLYRTNSYVMGPYTALAYGGLTDYRAKTGESRPALILAERSPMADPEVTAQVLGVDMSAFGQMLE